jgi:hypothetical protein
VAKSDRAPLTEALGFACGTTLWPISDKTTVQIMLDFYDAAFKSSNAAQALADTQRDWLVKLRKERGLLDAVRLAGAFIMSSRRK